MAKKGKKPKIPKYPENPEVPLHNEEEIENLVKFWSKMVIMLLFCGILGIIGVVFFLIGIMGKNPLMTYLGIGMFGFAVLMGLQPGFQKKPTQDSEQDSDESLAHTAMKKLIKTK